MGSHLFSAKQGATLLSNEPWAIRYNDIWIKMHYLFIIKMHLKIDILSQVVCSYENYQRDQQFEEYWILAYSANALVLLCYLKFVCVIPVSTECQPVICLSCWYNIYLYIVFKCRHQWITGGVYNVIIQYIQWKFLSVKKLLVSNNMAEFVISYHLTSLFIYCSIKGQ